jgi:site-specific DNA recombinase
VRKPIASHAKVFRCAIYTRKSSEEGLEQDFNSLHAQRESCDAYIMSQRHEGWTPLPTPYDDGGYSGGSTERPALKRLLADIQSDLIDVVVVYKVDRLTRSLADFAKIVEIFDAADVSFVSVTQQFNTTTSMGRLTLNVLLSFAQFEREVTGERIRDKIAASKQKGMWMGGWVPIGYDRKDRTLAVNETEAVTVRTISDLFLKLKNVRRVQTELIRLNLTTKPYATPRGRAIGGLSFARGHIYKILSNPLYIGEIEHRGVRYPGQHPPLIDREKWDAVQAQLAANHHENRTRTNAKSKSPLAGLIYDDAGNRLVSSHATKNGKRYRYYITSQGAQRSAATPDPAKLRLPASMIDELLRTKLQSFLTDRTQISILLRETRCRPAEIGSGLALANALAGSLTSGTPMAHNVAELLARVTVSHKSLKISVKRDRLLAILTDKGFGGIVKYRVKDALARSDHDQIVPAPKSRASSGKSKAKQATVAGAKKPKKPSQELAAELDEAANALQQEAADSPDDKSDEETTADADQVDVCPPPYIVDDAEDDAIGPGKSSYDPTLMAIVRDMDTQIDRQRILAKIPDHLRQLAFSLHMDREPQDVIARACGVSTRTIRTWIAEIQEELQQTKEAQELLERRAGAKT